MNDQTQTTADQTYCVEYSRQKDWFRVAPLEKILEQNLVMLNEGIPNDFVPLVIGPHQLCWRACDELEARVKQAE